MGLVVVRTLSQYKRLPRLIHSVVLLSTTPSLVKNT